MICEWAPGDHALARVRERHLEAQFGDRGAGGRRPGALEPQEVEDVREPSPRAAYEPLRGHRDLLQLHHVRARRVRADQLVRGRHEPASGGRDQEQ